MLKTLFRNLLMAALLITPFLLQAQEETLPEPVEGIALSGTLPVCYVNTVDGAPIVDKENYLDAEIWIDPIGFEMPEFGTKEKPLVTQIRGRGNSSWTSFGKRPYKIKLDKKNTPFDFPANKHFALIAHAPTQSYFRCEVSSELGRLIDLGWVPRTHPVELVLNGVNVGVYAFSETVRVASGRVDIEEQPEENTDPETIPYGWLIEIDNSDDTPQILIPQSYDLDALSMSARFTIKTPEVMSTEQEEWITSQLSNITRSVLNPDKQDNLWTNLIDLESLAKYYIVQEVSGNLDAFVGSTYMYKGDGEKWMFGPLWDSEWAYSSEPRTCHIWDERTIVTGYEDGLYVWVKDMLKLPEFQEEVRRQWAQFYPDKYNEVYSFVDEFYNLTKEAYGVNNLIWPDYISQNIDEAYYFISRCIAEYGEWFDQMVENSNFDSIDKVEVDNSSDTSVRWFNLAGMPFETRPTTPGIYIEVKDGKATKIRIE